MFYLKRHKSEPQLYFVGLKLRWGKVQCLSSTECERVCVRIYIVLYVSIKVEELCIGFLFDTCSNCYLCHSPTFQSEEAPTS